MLVKIRLAGEDEWSLLELQGHLDPRDVQQTLDSLPLGVLEADAANSKEFSLIIGSNKLVGKLVRLEKPLVVLTHEDNEHVAADAAGAGDEHWRAVGVVRNKVVFKTRPQPIVKR
jgi:hypothetical protein